MVALMEGFQIADFLTSAVQLVHNCLKGDVLFHHQHSEMVEQIGNLSHGLLLYAVFGRDQGLAALFPHLFEYLVQSLLKEIAGI